MGDTPASGHSQITTTDTVVNKFVDRKPGIDRFLKMLGGDDPARVFVAEGPAGAGKSWLLIRLQDEAAQKKIPTTRVEFSYGQVTDDVWMVTRLAREMGSENFTKLNEQLREGIKINVVVNFKIPPGGNKAEFHKDVIVKGDFIEGNVIKDNTFNLKTDDPRLRQDWITFINEAFITDLETLGSAKGAVLIFDAFEKATTEAKNWLKENILKPAGEGKLPGVVVLMAGDTPIPFDPAWKGLVAREVLTPFDRDDVREYFLEKLKRTIDDDTLERIFQVTRGQVDQIGLIGDYQQPLPPDLKTDELYKILVEGILSKPGEGIPQVLCAAALTDWFDAPAMAAMLGDGHAIDERLEEIRQFTFVSQDPSGALRISNQAVRDELYKTWEKKQQQYLELHHRAADYFQQRAGTVLDQSEKENLEIQATGHLLEFDERTGMQRLQALYQEAEVIYRLPTCQLLLQRAAKVNKLCDNSHLWLKYYEGRLAFKRHDLVTSAKQLKALLPKTEALPELQAQTNGCLGDVRAEQGLWGESIDDYNQSLAYYKAQNDLAKTGQIMMALCDIHIEQARAVGDPIRPMLVRGSNWKDFLKKIPSLLVALSFVIYSRLFGHWKLPPLQEGMNYRNWALVNLLLTAASWCENAEAEMKKAGNLDLIPRTQWRLAQIYYRLGWENEARDLFDSVLKSKAALDNPYWRAQARLEYAEFELVSGEREKAIKELKTALKQFIDCKDRRSQAEVCTLLGKAWMQAGKFGSGLALYRYSIDKFLQLNDHLSAGLAVQELNQWQKSASLRPEQLETIEDLIKGTPDKIYLLRVPDKLASFLEALIAASLVLLPLGALVAFSTAFVANMTDTGAFLAQLFLPLSVIRFIGIALLSLLLVVVGSSSLGLILIFISIRQKPKPELLGRIETRAPFISRTNYLGEEKHLAWAEIQAIVSQERIFWRVPLALLSEYLLVGSSKDKQIEVPATLSWYENLKTDINQHIRDNNLQPARLTMDMQILSSWQGIYFMLAPFLAGLGSALVYNWVELPVSIEAAALAGPILLWLGFFGFAVGPYWWLALHPLWVRYQQKPRTRALWAAVALGLALVSCAFYLEYFDPFFPIRQALDRGIFPLGFILLFVSSVWIIAARSPGTLSEAARTPAYPWWVRALASLLLAITLLATGIYARRVWLVDVLHNFQAITYYYHKDYLKTIARFDRALELNPNLVNAYYYQGRAYFALGNDALALEKYNHVVDSGNAIAADYVFRAQALRGTGNDIRACADLQSALNYHKWPFYISKEEQDKIKTDYWEPWNCDLTHQP